MTDLIIGTLIALVLGSPFILFLLAGLWFAESKTKPKQSPKEKEKPVPERMSLATRTTEIRNVISRISQFQYKLRNDPHEADEVMARVDAEYLVELLDPEIACPIRGRPKEQRAVRYIEERTEEQIMYVRPKQTTVKVVAIESEERQSDTLAAPPPRRKILTLRMSRQGDVE